MDQLVEAIYALGKRDWFDYLSVIAPMVLSVVAIWISISTARKQNQIALLELRHNALYQMKNILEFDRYTHGDLSSENVIFHFDMYFGTDLQTCSDLGDKLNKVVKATNQLEKDILVRAFARKQSERDEILQLINQLRLMMHDVIVGWVHGGRQKGLHVKCEAFENGTLKELEKRMQV